MKKFLTAIAIGLISLVSHETVHAFTNLTINGITYSFPEVDDENWGQNVTDWATAVTNGMLQKAGGTFTLTSDAYFGANFGLRAPYYKSNIGQQASTGTLRLDKNGIIAWRNANNTGDNTFSVNSSTLPTFNGYVLGFSTVADQNLFIATSTLQGNIDAVYVNMASTYTTLITAINSTNTAVTAAYVSAINSTFTALNSNFANIIIATSALNAQLQADATTYVNVTGDIMTGGLEIQGAPGLMITNSSISISGTDGSTQGLILFKNNIAYMWQIMNVTNGLGGTDLKFNKTGPSFGKFQFNGADFNVIDGSVTISGSSPFLDVRQGTGTFAGVVASTVSVNRGGSIVFGDGTKQITAASGSGASNTLIFREEGSALGGDVTAVDVVGANATASQSGSSVTLTITGGAGSATSTRYNTLVVGTSTVKGADTVVGGLASFDAMYATVGARGLLQTSTVTATILFQEGVYQNLSGITIPAGISISGVKGSSVVWTPTDNSTTFLTIHGSLDNVIIDAGGRAFGPGTFIRVSSGAYIGDGVKVINAGNFDQGGNTSLFVHRNCSGTYVGATVDGWAPNQQDIAAGGLATFERASFCELNLKTKNATPGGTTGKQHIVVSFSTGITINGDYDSMGERVFSYQGGGTNIVIKGNWRIKRSIPSVGVFYLRNLLADVSTGTVISANVFWETSNTAPVINFQADPGLTIGPLITNSYFYNLGQSGVPSAFVNIQAGTFGTVISNSHAYGLSTFLSDAGTGTLYTNMGNSINNKAP